MTGSTWAEADGYDVDGLDGWWQQAVTDGKARAGAGPAHQRRRDRLEAAGWVRGTSGWWYPPTGGDDR